MFKFLKFFILFFCLLFVSSYGLAKEIKIDVYFNNVNFQDETSKLKNKIFHYQGTINSDKSKNKYAMFNDIDKVNATGIKSLEIGYSLSQIETSNYNFKFSILFSYINLLSSEKDYTIVNEAFENEDLELNKEYKRILKNSNVLLIYEILDKEY